MGLIKPTFSKYQVPVLFQEPHVETGFRPLHQPWRYYFLSLFQQHNECLNTWTHLVAVVLMAQRLYAFSYETDLIHDPHMWPFLAGMITMILLYLCSSGAHCFQSRSEIVHYTCFMIDYAGIGLYGLGSVILHFAYCSDEWLYTSLQDVYLPIGILLSLSICVCCSISKTMYSRPYPFMRKVWQLGSVTTVYSWLILPIAHRLLRCVEYGEWSPSMPHHIQQMIWFITSGFFFGSDIPQRFFPGKFDFLGHSHQLFHICIMMTSYKQMDAVVLDIEQYRAQIYARPTPTLLSTFGAVAFLVLANTLVVLGFREYIKSSCKTTCKIEQNGKSEQNGIYHAKHE